MDPQHTGQLDYKALRIFLDEAGLQPTTSDVRHIMRELDPARCCPALHESLALCVLVQSLSVGSFSGACSPS